MNRIVIYDSLSYLRVRMETERGPDFLRGVLNETQKPGAFRIWTWDGPGGNGARRKIFPAYKTSREYQPGVSQAMDFVRELIGLTPSWQVRIPGFEGDDVIASLVEHFLASTDLPIEIHCRDGDLVALCALSPRVSCTHSSKVPYGLIRLYKTCVGDPSDDIPGIKGFGKGAWEKADKVGLRRLIDRVLAREEWTEAEALSVGMSKASSNWLQVSENVDQLGAMRRIIDPLPVPRDVLEQHLVQGTNDPAALEAKMKEFFL